MYSMLKALIKYLYYAYLINTISITVHTFKLITVNKTKH